MPIVHDGRAVCHVRCECLARHLRLVIPGSLLAAFAIWEGAQTWPSEAARISVAMVIALIVAGTVGLGKGRQPSTSASWVRGSWQAARGWRRQAVFAVGVAAWVALILAFAGWDANSFAHEVHYLPTLSYELGRVTRFWWGRTLVFLGWFLVGLWLATGRLAPRRRSGPGPEDPPS
jgi:hypothetical protein